MANLITSTEDFTVVEWTKGTCTIVADDAVAPDGTTTADKIRESTGSSPHDIGLNKAGNNGSPYTFSCFIKKPATGRDYACIVLTAGSQYIYQYFDATTGGLAHIESDGSDYAYTSESFGNGWFRVSVTLLNVASAGILHVAVAPAATAATNGEIYAGDTNYGLYAWGTVLEETDTPSSYVSASSWASGPASQQASYAQFDTGGAWRIRQWERDAKTFSLKLEEPKNRLKVKIPTTLFDQTAYPNIADDLVGEPIPIAYGQIYGAEAICIDASTRTFKVAGHAINGFDAVRVYDSSNEVWNGASFGSPNLTNATFTLTAGEWDGKARVAVDFRGKEISAGVLMDNAADVVNDLLTVEVGIPSADVDATTLAESNAKLEVGTDRYGNQSNHRRLAIYLDEQTEAIEVIEAINASVGSYLFPDHDGLFRYVVFQPEPGNGLTLFDEASVFSFEAETESMDIISQIRMKYARNIALDTFQSSVATDAKAQYLTGATAPLSDERELPIYREGDANYIAGRAVRMEGRRRKTYRMKCSHIAFPLLPGDFVKVELTRGSIDAVFEVLERKINLPGLSIELRLGDLHGLRDEAGFWVGASPTFPASLGGASCATWSSGWSAAQKAWARQNVGYWTDDNGFADSADPDSFIPSAWV